MDSCGRVLVVEDDISVRETLVALLEYLGLAVVTAPNGTEALRQAERYQGQLDAVLLDIELPGLLGTEVCRRLSTRWSGLPVVLMSGYLQPSLAGLGARCLIEKPFGIKGLTHALRHVGVALDDMETRAA